MDVISSDSILIGKRKVERKGAGFSIMLPAIWIRNTGVSAGDRLKVEMRGGSLIMTADKKDRSLEVVPI